MGRLTVRKIDIYGNKYIATGGGAYFEEESVYKALEKLAHYEDMEEQGRLIEVVYGFNKYDHNSAFECSVCEFSDWDTLTADGGRTGTYINATYQDDMNGMNVVVEDVKFCPMCGAKLKELKE